MLDSLRKTEPLGIAAAVDYAITEPSSKHCVGNLQRQKKFFFVENI